MIVRNPGRIDTAQLKIQGLMLVAVLSVIPYSTVAQADRIVAGVNVDAVNWASLCANVEPIPLKTKDNSCPAAHPGSGLHEDLGSSYLGGREPKVDCKLVHKEYLKLRKPKTGPLPWLNCQRAFEASLHHRSISPEAFVEPFAVWRARYFTVTAP